MIAGASDLRAETIHFAPQTYASSLSAAQAPALKVKSGDRVVTTTAEGQSAKGSSPQTGPFFIDGAEPGDMLLVTIEKLAPSGTKGTSSWAVSANAVDPEKLAKNKGDTTVPWTIDKDKGVVRLDLTATLPGNPPWVDRFNPATFELPLQPMLGSFGVAPAGEGDASTPGSFGGSVNYSGMTAGVKVMLPVSQPGAMLFLGRGMARQGAGNITGSGIETAMNVEFTVEVIKKKEWPHSTVNRASTIAGEFPIEWPRLETDSYVMTIGSGDGFVAALQAATMELHHWLDDDFGLSERSVSVLLGQALEYEIASVSGPKLTVVAKVRKADLPRPIIAP